MEDRREQLIREGFESWERGNVEDTLALYDSQIEVYSPPEVGNPGTFHGIDGFLRWAQTWQEAWESFTQELIRVEPVGDGHALAVVDQVGVGKGSGIRVERRATWVYEIRDEKLVYLAIFFDHDRALALAREREGAD